MKIENTIPANVIYKPTTKVQEMTEDKDIGLNPVVSLDDLRLDEDFEVIKTEDFFVEMEKRKEKVELDTKIMHIVGGYMGDAFQKMFQKQLAAVQYALTDRVKFNELMHGSMTEYEETMKPLYELNNKYAEDHDLEAFLGSSLFDLYR